MQMSPTTAAMKDGVCVIGYDLIHYGRGTTEWALSSAGHSHQLVTLTGHLIMWGWSRETVRHVHCAFLKSSMSKFSLGRESVDCHRELWSTFFLQRLQCQCASPPPPYPRALHYLLQDNTYTTSVGWKQARGWGRLPGSSCLEILDILCHLIFPILHILRFLKIFILFFNDCFVKSAWLNCKITTAVKQSHRVEEIGTHRAENGSLAHVSPD